MLKSLINSWLAVLILCSFSFAEEIKMQEFVAHGGGAINNIAQTNSLEALNYNYKRGFRFFEIDFEWTSDKELVLIHDWKECLKRLFNAEPEVCSLEKFKGLKMVSGLTQMALKDMIKWMASYPDIYIITDIKSDNIKGLNKIADEYPDLKNRFIPQIYRYEEYEKAKGMGFHNIILTLYVMNYADNETVAFLERHKVSALTIWHYRANQDFVDKLKKLNIFIYVHTVNDVKLKDILKKIKVNGFYTDYISPEDT